MGDDQVGIRPQRPVHQQFGGVGQDGVVGVHELQVLPLGVLQPQVAGGGHPAVGLVDEDDAFVHPGVHLAHLQAHILAAVVEQQDFDILVGLAANTFDTARNMVLCVVDRHNDADQRLILRHGNIPPLVWYLHNTINLHR